MFCRNAMCDLTDRERIGGVAERWLGHPTDGMPLAEGAL